MPVPNEQSAGLQRSACAQEHRRHVAVEYLDITQALAGDGVAIGSPILFKAELDAGRLVPAHDLVATDGRAFWFTVPVVREDSRKISQFRDWIQDEAAAARDSAAEYIRRVAAG